MANHSATHLTQKALKIVLGDHIHQQGSQVSAEEMRFDFNDYSNLTDEEILKVEAIVKEQINSCHDVVTKTLPIDEAKQMGAEALFGEKYGDFVRVVDMDFSKELCGGTHVKNTKDIIDYAITSVESIGSGIYRITAVTGSNALNQLMKHLVNQQYEMKVLLEKAKRLIAQANEEQIELEFNFEETAYEKATYGIVIDYRLKLEKLKEMVKELEKEYNRKKASKALSNLSAYDMFIEGNSLVAVTEDLTIDLLKQLVDALLDKLGKGVVFMASIIDNKAIFVCKNNINLHSGELVKKAAMITGGNGGGRPDMATAGGKNISLVSEALNVIRAELKGKK